MAISLKWMLCYISYSKLWNARWVWNFGTWGKTPNQQHQYWREKASINLLHWQMPCQPQCNPNLLSQHKLVRMMKSPTMQRNSLRLIEEVQKRNSNNSLVAELLLITHKRRRDFIHSYQEKTTDIIKKFPFLASKKWVWNGNVAKYMLYIMVFLSHCLVFSSIRFCKSCLHGLLSKGFLVACLVRIFLHGCMVW